MLAYVEDGENERAQTRAGKVLKIAIEASKLQEVLQDEAVTLMNLMRVSYWLLLPSRHAEGARTLVIPTSSLSIS